MRISKLGWCWIVPSACLLASSLAGAAEGGASSAAPSGGAEATTEGASGTEIQNMRVGGTRLINEASDEAGIRPFNDLKGFCVSLIGGLPDSIILIKKVSVTTAVADTGASLMPDDDRRHIINMPRLSKNQRSVVFECPLRAPTPDVKGVKELTGSVTCVIGRGTKEVDLGKVALRAGSQGQALDARIESVNKAWNQADTYELGMSIRTEFGAVKDVKLIDDNGAEIPMETSPLRPEGRLQFNNTASRKVTPSGTEIILQRGGFSRFGEQNDTVQILMTHHGDFPPEAKIVVEMYDRLEECAIPFKIENFDLSGRPMK